MSNVIDDLFLGRKITLLGGLVELTFDKKEGYLIHQTYTEKNGKLRKNTTEPLIRIPNYLIEITYPSLRRLPDKQQDSFFNRVSSDWKRCQAEENLDLYSARENRARAYMMQANIIDGLAMEWRGDDEV